MHVAACCAGIRCAAGVEWVAYLLGAHRGSAPESALCGRPLLLIGKADGSVSAIDYEKKEVVATYAFERKSSSSTPVAVTSLCFSPNGEDLLVGHCAAKVRCFLEPT